MINKILISNYLDKATSRHSYQLFCFLWFFHLYPSCLIGGASGVAIGCPLFFAMVVFGWQSIAIANTFATTLWVCAGVVVGILIVDVVSGGGVGVGVGRALVIVVDALDAVLRGGHGDLRSIPLVLRHLQDLVC